MVNTTERQSLTKLDVMPLLALFGLTILLFSRDLLSWPTPLIFPTPGFQYGTDLMRESWSIFRFTSDVFHQSGAFPLWRPNILSGAPLIGHPVAPVMYLPNWLTLILPLPLAFNILIIVHLWWAGVGTYLYLRLQAGLTSGAALIGALIFSFAPRLFTHIGGGHLPLIEAVAWWPWAWFFFSRYWDSKRLRWAVFLGISLAAHAVADCGRGCPWSVRRHTWPVCRTTGLYESRGLNTGRNHRRTRASLFNECVLPLNDCRT